MKSDQILLVKLLVIEKNNIMIIRLSVLFIRHHIKFYVHINHITGREVPPDTDCKLSKLAEILN